jgi:hypothetical protein
MGRSAMADLIKSGDVRVNWREAKKPSQVGSPRRGRFQREALRWARADCRARPGRPPACSSAYLASRARAPASLGLFSAHPPPPQELKEGDVVSVSGKGRLEVKGVGKTKKEKFLVQMVRLV